jgi:hypothetical protein
MAFRYLGDKVLLVASKTREPIKYRNVAIFGLNHMNGQYIQSLTCGGRKTANVMVHFKAGLLCEKVFT